MTEQEILNIISSDEYMMRALRVAEELKLKDWLIGAGFVRNKVWDHLHGFSKKEVDTADIDLVYFNPVGNDEEADQKLSQKLNEETGLTWEVVNQFYAARWHGDEQYESTEDAISQWPETVTAVGVYLKNGQLYLVAPYGIDDLVNLVVRKSPKFKGDDAVFQQRMKQKQWFKKWPKLTLAK